MIEEVSENIYKVIIPLPIALLGSINSYAVVDPDRNLIIDPGLAHTVCFEAMKTAVNKLGIDLKRTDFFITHHHPDHFSLVSQFMAEKSVIYINRSEADLMKRVASGLALVDLTHLFEKMGFPAKNPEKFLPELTGMVYGAGQSWPFRYVGDNDVIRIGEWCFRCIVTPGHCTAHTCLYEPDRKIIFSGDAISPVLQFYSEQANPLADCLTSFHRLSYMRLDLALPGHRAPFRDCRSRIDRLKAHFVEKSKTVFAALRDGEKDSYQVAIKVWQGGTDNVNWDALPMVQKFFLTRDCFALLKYLEAMGQVQQKLPDPRIQYFQQFRND